MPREFSRTHRVGEEIQRTLAGMLQREARDPRLARVTISAVEVSRDLAHAKVFYSSLEPETAQVQRALEHASGFLRTALARTLKMRSVPELRFVHDTSMEYGNRLAALIDEAVAPRGPESDEEQN